MNAWLRLLAVIAAALVPASSASAHVHVVAPPTSPGARTVFTVGVPNERSDAATARVALRIPAEFQQVRPVTARGWRVARSRDGDATVLTWSGGRITGTGRVEHSFRAIAPPAGSYTIPAAQTYDDGQVVRWIGGPDAEFPAPVVTIGDDGAVLAPAPAHTLPAAPASAGEEGTAETAPANGDDGNGAPIAAIAGGAAGVVIVGAVVGVIVRRRRGGERDDR